MVRQLAADQGGAHAHRQLVPSEGRVLGMKGTLTARDGADFRRAVATAAPSTTTAPPVEDAATSHSATAAPASHRAQDNDAQATLLDHKQRQIETTLAACGGNIAKAARALGVSGGLLYRRLQKTATLAGDTDQTPASVA